MKPEWYICLLALVGALGLIVYDILQKRKRGELTLGSAKDIAMSVVEHVALALLTEAERMFGSGTGELKMSYCIAKLIELLPEAVIEIVPKKDLQEYLEKALEVAKEKWLKNPRLLNNTEDS